MTPDPRTSYGPERILSLYCKGDDKVYGPEKKASLDVETDRGMSNRGAELEQGAHITKAQFASAARHLPESA